MRGCGGFEVGGGAATGWEHVNKRTRDRVAVLLKDGFPRSDASLAPPCPSRINPLQNGSVPGTDPSQNPH